jgi:tRNA A37 threonylcarbamoyladenosine dehydratase
MKMYRNDIIEIFSIDADQITITNGNRNRQSVSRIYDKNGNKIFETNSVWNGVVSINKKQIDEIKSALDVK